MTPAEELRQAADRIEALAAGSDPSPDFWSRAMDLALHEGVILGEGDAAWIAAMSPKLAPHLAATLRAAADSTVDDPTPTWRAALAFARAVNGTAEVTA